MVLFQFYCLPNDCRVFSSDALCKTMLRVKWIIPCKLFISWNLDIHVSMDSKLDLMLLHHSMKLIYCLSRTVMLSRFFILLLFFSIIDLVMRMHYGFILCKCNRNSYCYSLSYCYGSFLYVFFFFFFLSSFVILMILKWRMLRSKEAYRLPHEKSIFYMNYLF